MRVRWLLRAVEDLEDIRDYIALDNPSAAQKEVEKILDSVSGLSENPGVGRIGRVPKTQEFVIPKSPYIAAYGRKKGARLVIWPHGLQVPSASCIIAFENERRIQL